MVETSVLEAVELILPTFSPQDTGSAHQVVHLGPLYLKKWKGARSRWLLRVRIGLSLEGEGGEDIGRAIMLLSAHFRASSDKQNDRGVQEWKEWLKGQRQSWQKRPINTAAALDHRNWLGTLGRTVLRTGFHVVRQAVRGPLLQALLEAHQKLLPSCTAGWAIHCSNGLRGTNLYFPGRASQDAYCRGKGGFVELKGDAEGPWMELCQLVRQLAGRDSLPDDIDVMCAWPGSIPQEWHQDGTFCMLACTVHLTAARGTVFANYMSKDFMQMDKAGREAYVQDKFEGVKSAAYGELGGGQMQPGDICFFNTGHLHKSPALVQKRGSLSYEQQIRRTIFLGFCSDRRLCNTDVVRNSNYNEVWEQHSNRTLQESTQIWRQAWDERWTKSGIKRPRIQ